MADPLPPQPQPALARAPIVFLSYAHADEAIAMRFRDVLMNRGLTVNIDVSGLRPNEDITEFARQSVQDADATICLISRESLASVWVMFEAVTTLHKGIGNPSARLIACALDASYTEDQIRHDIVAVIDARLQRLTERMTSYFQKGLDLADAAIDYDRLVRMRSTLGDVLTHLKNRLTPALTPNTLDATAAKIVEYLHEELLKSLPPDDARNVRRRANEVRRNLADGSTRHALKQALDFVHDFSDLPDQINAIIFLSNALIQSELDERDGRLSSADAEGLRRPLIAQVLTLIDEIEAPASTDTSASIPARAAVPAAVEPLDWDLDGLRAQTQSDPRRAATRLVDLASVHADDRRILHRAVLLKRNLSRSSHATPAHVSEALAILDALIEDGATERRAVEERFDHRADRQQRHLLITLTRKTAVAVQTINLTKTYKKHTFSLENVSLDVRYTQILGVVGRNANGKTTLLRLLVGNLRQDAGEIRYPGIEETTGSRRWADVARHIAYVPQVLQPWHGVLRSNLHYEAAFRGLRGVDNEREVDFIVERLGLRSEQDRRWDELSGGFQLRFALARALVWRPRLLVLDEPLANLDFMTQQVVLEDLRTLVNSLRYPLAVIISSQHLHEIEAVSDSLLVLSRGRVTYFGATSGLGEKRRENRFELSGTIDIRSVEAALADIDGLSVRSNGLYHVVTTSIGVPASDILRRLLNARLPVDYFRDISKSAKHLLMDDDYGE